jgi:cytochrome c oxidase subunit 3
MTVILVFLAVLMFVFVGWLVSQSINVQPWVASGVGEVAGGNGGIQDQPPTKVALVVLIAVLASLFALFMSAYVLRMELPDWRPLPEPALLWLNTLMLALGSVGMQWAYSKSAIGNRNQIATGLIFAGICLSLFILGQVYVWQMLTGLGYYATSNPANAFFYLITGLHVIHLVGGLVAWTATIRKVRSASNMAEVRLSIQLCGVYIHFLLIVWFVLFALMLNT